MAYQNPGFVNNTEPYLNAQNLNAIADTLECVPVENGGTGATTAANARANLGLNTEGVNAMVNGTALPVTNGGTGATTAANARANLGLNKAGINALVNGNALPIANGGTGATTVAAARNALGLGNTSGAVPIASGGTGATSVAAARNNLGLGNTSGAVPVASGGTGATTAANARTNLGLTEVASTIAANVFRYVPVNEFAYEGRLNLDYIECNCVTRVASGYTIVNGPAGLTSNFYIITFQADATTRRVQFCIPETGKTIYMQRYHGSSYSGWSKITFTDV